MLAFTSGLKSLPVQAKDGEIGSVHDLLFDDQTLDVRWAVVDTGSWLPGRLVLIPPVKLEGVNSGQSLRVELTRRQVEDSPPIEHHEPVSRRMEASIYGYYNWVPYWNSPALTGPFPAAPYGIVPSPANKPPRRSGDLVKGKGDDAHLRSATEIIGYYLEGRDGSLGHIEDLLIEELNWTVRSLVIDTKNWWPGKKVVIPASWLVGISWSNRVVNVRETRDTIKRAPEYKHSTTLASDLYARSQAERDVEGSMS